MRSDSQPLGGEAVDMRRMDVRVAVAAERLRAVLVPEDPNDVARRGPLAALELAQLPVKPVDHGPRGWIRHLHHRPGKRLPD